MFGWLRRVLFPAPPTEQQLKMEQALADYPPYTPPPFRPELDLVTPGAADAEYADYFFGTMPARREALRAFLLHFDVELSADDAGLAAISAWLPQWGELLAYDYKDKEAQNAFHRLGAPWTGRLLALNVIFDLGVYYAECLWTRRTNLKWEVMRFPDICIHSVLRLPGGKGFAPMDFVYSECDSIRRDKEDIRKRRPGSEYSHVLKPDSFSRHVLAKTPRNRRWRKQPWSGSWTEDQDDDA